MYILHVYLIDTVHRRRKILRVGGAEYPTAREARAKLYGHAHFVLNHVHFGTIEDAITSFSMKK